MLTVLQQVLILFLFALAGYVLCRTRLADANHSKLLATLGVYLFLPCTVFKTFSRNFTRQYIAEKYWFILISTALLVVVVVVARLVACLLTNNAYTRNVYRYSLIVPNVGYMGYALAEALYGEATMLNVMIFALPISIYTYTAGFCILTKNKLTLKTLIHPVILALLAGCVVGLTELKLPEIAYNVLDTAAGCMAPISMILTGMTISQFRLGDILADKKAYIVSGIRLIALPVAVALSLKLFCDTETILAAVIVYAMPCGLNTIVFPKLVGEDCRSGAALACISTVSACITIPLCLTLLV